MKNKNATPSDMAQALLTCSGRLVIAAHLRPDGDAAGAALALCLSLKAAGRRAVCVGIEPLGDEFNFFEGRDEIIPAQHYVPLDDDVMVVVDCGDFSRIPEALRGHAEKIIGFCIDHHKSNPGFAPLGLIDPSSSSSCELVQAVLEAGEMPMTRGVAEALWVGMATDTGRFSYASTSPATFRRAAVLLEHGARFAMINDAVFCRVELRRLRLQRRLLESLEVSGDGRVAVASLCPADYEAEQCSSIDSDSFVDVVRSVKGVQIALFIRQASPHRPVNISLRTIEPFDASQICAEWGGGGHARAAGATIKGTLAEQRNVVFSHLKEVASRELLETTGSDR